MLTKNSNKHARKNSNCLCNLFNKIVHGTVEKTIKLIESGKIVNDERYIAKTMNNVFHYKVETIYKEIPEVTNESQTEISHKHVEGNIFTLH